MVSVALIAYHPDGDDDDQWLGVSCEWGGKVARAQRQHPGQSRAAASPASPTASNTHGM